MTKNHFTELQTKKSCPHKLLPIIYPTSVIRLAVSIARVFGLGFKIALMGTQIQFVALRTTANDAPIKQLPLFLALFQDDSC